MVLGACSDRNRQAGSVPQGPSAPPSFWVWHRRSDLTEAERATLGRAGVDRLYWQVAECEWRGGKWHSTEIARNLADTGKPAVIPVFRIKPGAEFLGDPGSAATLARQIQAWWNRPEPLAEVQFDFDCPGRVLTEYARFLAEMKRLLAPAKISATALASWPQVAGFDRLARTADSLVPMFYDLAADAPADVLDGRYKPLADADVARWIGLWHDCPAPWFAGLPNFERVSVFQPDGGLSGHLRGWNHDGVLFHPALSGRAAGPGVVEFRVESGATLSGTRVVPGQRVVWRTTDENSVRRLGKVAADAGARGVVYFALPGPGLQAAFSPEHLAAGPGGTATLAAHETPDGAVVLENPGPRDLPARAIDPDAPGERGWALVLDAPARGAFREATPGEFLTTQTGGNLPAGETTTLVLRFSRLPAGAAIRSGPCLARTSGVRWQVKGSGTPVALDEPEIRSLRWFGRSVYR